MQNEHPHFWLKLNTYTNWDGVRINVFYCAYDPTHQMELESTEDRLPHPAKGVERA